MALEKSNVDKNHGCYALTTPTERLTGVKLGH